MHVSEIGEKANVVPIIRAHFDTMADFRRDRRSAGDLFFFYGLPSVCAAVLVARHFAFFLDSVNGFLNAFAILTGLMLNLLVLVFTLSASTAQREGSSQCERADYLYRRRILKEVFISVCYCIVLAVTVTAVALFSLTYLHGHSGGTDRVSTFLLTSLTMNFILTLLMVIKRMYKLIIYEFDRPSLRKAA